MAMRNLIEMCDQHEAFEGVEIEARVDGGIWIDVRDAVTPVQNLLNEILDRCNMDALDEDALEGTAEFIQGRSSLAHELLRMAANHDHTAES